MTATVVQFVPRALPTDGGKARILRKRCDDLRMDHVDNGVPSDAPYHAPERDPA